ncbi:hypothetical protein [Oerskovia paurometabola]|uniref:hypothetical protein n=1 Tax=Oerskovia paurometabola TaxID=162170 RepID=UPI00342DB4E8
MFVLTVDQRASTRRGDLVPEVLATLAPFDARDGVVIGFDRTVGDEVQAVLDDAALVVEIVLALGRWGGWSTGLGLGDVLPGPNGRLPAASREASGSAFVHARAAVERAKTRGTHVPLAVEGPDRAAAGEVEALLRLLLAVGARRTPAGWEVVDALARVGGTQKDVARDLGISEQAVSQRLRASLWSEEAAVRPVVTRLLQEADA